MADISEGKKVFVKMCAQCHTAEEGGARKAGPNLYELIRRKRNISWNAPNLDRYLGIHMKYMPTTKDKFSKVEEQDKEHLVAYLKHATKAPEDN